MADKDHDNHPPAHANHASHHEPDIEHHAGELSFPTIPESSGLDKLYGVLAPLTWVGMLLFAFFMFSGHPYEAVGAEGNQEPAAQTSAPSPSTQAEPAGSTSNSAH